MVDSQDVRRSDGMPLTNLLDCALTRIDIFPLVGVDLWIGPRLSYHFLSPCSVGYAAYPAPRSLAFEIDFGIDLIGPAST